MLRLRGAMKSSSDYSDDEAGVRAWLDDNGLSAIADVLVKVGVDTISDLVGIKEIDKDDFAKEGLKPIKFNRLREAVDTFKSGNKNDNTLNQPASGDGGGETKANTAGDDPDAAAASTTTTDPVAAAAASAAPPANAGVAYLLDINMLTFGEFLGKGAFGEVLLGTFDHNIQTGPTTFAVNSTAVAIKTVLVRCLSSTNHALLRTRYCIPPLPCFLCDMPVPTHREVFRFPNKQLHIVPLSFFLVPRELACLVSGLVCSMWSQNAYAYPPVNNPPLPSVTPRPPPSIPSLHRPSMQRTRKSRSRSSRRTTASPHAPRPSS